MSSSRAEAEALLFAYTEGDNLRKHALGVEAAMRAYARRFGEDEEEWGIAGLIHDFDYERNPSPDSHPYEGAKILRERGYPEEVVEAVLGHAEYTGVPRRTRMAQALFAVDELVGLITAVALVRPSKDVREVDVRSVRKKWKDKAFAKGVKREDIERGAAELGVPLEEHVEVVLSAMKEIAPQPGLAGEGGAGGGH
ncbi:MAG: HD domain-containing protein [Nitrospinota bacterium]